MCWHKPCCKGVGFTLWMESKDRQWVFHLRRQREGKENANFNGNGQTTSQHVEITARLLKGDCDSFVWIVYIIHWQRRNILELPGTGAVEWVQVEPLDAVLKEKHFTFRVRSWSKWNPSRSKKQEEKLQSKHELWKENDSSVPVD